MKKKMNEFDLLRQWSLLSDSELKASISDDTLSVLRKIVRLLDHESGVAVSQSNFIETVRKMYDLMKSGSQRLGEAIIEASKKPGQYIFFTKNRKNRDSIYFLSR